MDYVNMERLKFVYDNFIEFYRDEYYLDALKIFKEWRYKEIFTLAKYYFREGGYERAIYICN